jgi:hypothetical protein
MLALRFQIDGHAVADSVERESVLGISLRTYTLNSAWLVRDDDKRGVPVVAVSYCRYSGSEA